VTGQIRVIGAVVGLIPLLFVLSLGLGVTALTLGLVGRGRARRGIATNRKVALWGTITGALAMVLGVVGIGIVINAADNLSEDLDDLGSSTVQVEGEAPEPESSGPVSEPESDGPAAVQVGETVTVTTNWFDGDATADVVVANPTTATVEPGEYGMEPQNGLFVAVDVTAVAAPDSEGSFSVNPFNFRFVAADGTVYDHAFVTSFDPQLNAVELAAGQRTAGKVVFDIVPGQETGGHVELVDNMIDSTPLATWAI
jgi:Domain of unknown function (DUF4352)